jgi:SAM-dependent methyltransferase
MEKVNCNLCRYKKSKLLFRKEGYRIVKCWRCGLIFVNPRDESKIFQKRYSEPYFHISEFIRKNPQIVGYWDYIADRPTYERYFEKKMRLIEKLHPKKGRILDFGSGLGYFLNQARKHGWLAFGLEISPFAVKYAKEKFNHQIILGQLTRERFPFKYFDVITLFQTIEHLPDPLAEVKNIYKFLKKDGILVITTPNADSLIAKILGKKWFAFRPKEHLFVFSANTIQKMLVKAGFKVIIIKSDDLVDYPGQRILERVEYNYRSWPILKLTKTIRALMHFLKLSKLKYKIPVGDIIVVARK